MPKRVLIVEPRTTPRLILKNGLSDTFYSLHFAATGAECLSLARRDQTDLILLSLELPDRSGIEVLAMLKADARCCHIPVIALASPEQLSLRLAALEAGAEDVLAYPVDPTLLVARMRNLVRFRQEYDVLSHLCGELQPLMAHLAEGDARYLPAAQMVVVASDKAAALRWRNRLPQALRANTQIFAASDVRQSIAAAALHPPDILLFDASGRDSAERLRLMSQIAAHHGLRETMYCVAIADSDGLHRAAALDLGAHDVISPEIDSEELQSRLSVLFRRKTSAEAAKLCLRSGLRMAATDPLTGAFNRRYAMPRLQEIAQTAAAEGQSFSLLLLDIDHFKAVNDSHGHAAGDHVLVEVVSRLRSCLRPSDLLARIGGEEFLVALPRVALPEARDIADHLRAMIATEGFEIATGQPPLSISLSIGVTDNSRLGSDIRPEHLKHLIEEADAALIRAKAEGRNRVTFRPQDLAEVKPLGLRL